MIHIKKKKFLLSVLSSASACFLIFSLIGCARTKAAIEPMDEAPQNSTCLWRPITAECGETQYTCPLIPKISRTEKLTLSELIDVALSNSPDTKITWSEAKAQAANFGMSLSDYFPKVDFTASWQRERQTELNEHAIPPQTRTTVYYRTTMGPALNISYTIFDCGQRRSFSERARQSLYYANRSHNYKVQSLVEEILNDYYDYQLQKDTLLANIADLETAQTTLEAAEKKFLTGVASIGDVSQAKTSYLQTKMDLIEQENKKETSLAKLIADLGLPANFPAQIEDITQPVYLDKRLEEVDHLVKIAHDNRQDLIAQMDLVQYAKEDLAYAKALSRPKLVGTFETGRYYFNANEREDYHFTANLKLTLPLFYGFNLKNQVREKEADLQKSMYQLAQKELNVIEDITKAHISTKNAAKTLVCAKEYLDAAKEQFRIALSTYKAGTNTILDLLSAQSMLADARAKEQEASKNWYTSLVSLASSTGTLFTPVPCECCEKRLCAETSSPYIQYERSQIFDPQHISYQDNRVNTIDSIDSKEKKELFDE